MAKLLVKKIRAVILIVLRFRYVHSCIQITSEPMSFFVQYTWLGGREGGRGEGEAVRRGGGEPGPDSLASLKTAL